MTELLLKYACHTGHFNINSSCESLNSNTHVNVSKYLLMILKITFFHHVNFLGSCLLYLSNHVYIRYGLSSFKCELDEHNM